jgi:hypothetical protein
MRRPRSQDEFRRLQREEDNLLEENLGHRVGVYRRALVFTPSAALFIVFFVIALLALLDGRLGAILGCVLLAVVAFALGYEAIAALRDLRTEPVVTSGQIQRLWTKSKFLVFGKAGYVLLQGRVFEVRVDTFMLLEPGQHLSIEHWPHTNLLVAMHRDPSGSSTD